MDNSVFCLQYLTIKVCDYKLCDITFAVLKMTATKKRINKIQTNKKQRKRIMESRIKKILGKVRAWYVDYREYRRAVRTSRFYELAKRRSREEVQIMEYRGEMYICCRGIPIVREEDLGASWYEVLEMSRKVYEEWLIEREMDK